MKKLLIVFTCILWLSACKAPEKTPEEQVLQIAHNEYVLSEIEELQAQLERGEITEKYASERLKQILKERQRLNSGSTEVILEKIEDQDPMLEKILVEMIEQRQGLEAGDGEE